MSAQRIEPLTAERCEELAHTVGGCNGWPDEIACALRNLAAGIRECEAMDAAYERSAGHIGGHYENGKFDAYDRIRDILTRSPSEPHDASPSTGDSQA